MVQLINTAFAVYEMHAQSGRTREAQRIRSVVENQLAPFTATMPKAVPVGAQQPPAAEAAVPRAVDVARRGMAPIRPGSVVPTTPTPATPAKTYQSSQRETAPGLDR
jgi:nucleotide-binding universal stress UspA family protein